MRRACALVVLAAGLAALSGAPAASAASTRYATPTGGTSSGGCTNPLQPCTLQQAVGNAATAGDVISLADGAPYDLGPGGLTVLTSVTFEPTDPKTRPVLTAATAKADTPAVALQAAGAALHRVEVRTSGAAPGPAVVVSAANIDISDALLASPLDAALTTVGAPAGLVVRRSVIDGGLWAAQIAGTVADSLLISSFGGGAALATPVTGGAITAVNVTAVSSSDGAVAYGNPIGLAGGGTITFRNSIVRADGMDGLAISPTCVPLPPCAAGVISATNTIMRPGGGVSLGAGTLASDPLFESAADHHLQRTSPAVDRGVPDPLSGTTDLDGNPRVVGGAIDLGAYEVQPPPAPAAVPPATASGTPTASAGTSLDTTPPVLGRLALTRSRFRVAASPTAVAAGRRRATPRGTRIDTATSEPGSLRLGIALALPGRRSGARCLQPSRALRRARPCSRLVSVGTLTRAVAAPGPVSIVFTGRVGRRALAAGRYQLSGVALDAAGNRSAVRTARLTITG